MKFARFGKTWLALAFALSAVAFQQTCSASSLTASEVVGKAVSRAHQAASTARADYSYTKVTLTEERDATGKLRERKERVYQISFSDGASFARLVEVNGHSPLGADLKKQAENESNARQLFGSAKPVRNEEVGHFLTAETTARYNFRLVGVAPLNGRNAYEIAFQPKSPGLPQHRIMDRLLDRLSGTLWIDAQEFEVARGEIRLSSEVDLLGGVLGCLRKMVYTVTRSRVADGLWLNSESNGDFEGRKLLDSVRIKTRSQCINFHTVALNR